MQKSHIFLPNTSPLVVLPIETKLYGDDFDLKSMELLSILQEIPVMESLLQKYMKNILSDLMLDLFLFEPISLVGLWHQYILTPLKGCFFSVNSR